MTRHKPTAASTSVLTEDVDIILHVIVIISIALSILFEALQCLISLSFVTTTQSPGQSVMPSTTGIRTSTLSTKNQPQSPSTTSANATVDQKKVAGGTRKVAQATPTAFSPRSKRSSSSSNASKTSRSQTKRTSDSRQRHGTMTSTSPTDTQSPILPSDLTTADVKHINTDASTQHQPTESIQLLPQPQEEERQDTLLCSKDSMSELQA